MADAAGDMATLIIDGGFDADAIICAIPFIEQAFPASAGRTGTTITLDFTDEAEAKIWPPSIRTPDVRDD